MNRNDDLNHTLEAWLRREAPAQAPDRVLEAALDRVATESQRQSWRQRLFGATRVATLIRAAALTAVVATAVLVGLQLSNLAPDVGGPSPSPPPSGSASSTPAATPVVVAPDNLLPPNSLARVLVEIELREGPGTGGPALTTIAAGQAVYVHAGEFGPVTVEGVTYYPAEYALNFAGWPASVDGGLEGWVPTERDGVPLVEIAPVVCPVDPPRPAELAGMTAWARLSCYGDRELVLEGRWVSGYGGYVPWDGEPAWLVLPSAEHAIYDGGGQFYFVLAPNVVLPAGLEAKGGSVRITGHFDDPAAATCVIRAGEPIVEQPAASVGLFCRERFVVTSLELLAASCVNPPTVFTDLIEQADPVACYGNAPLTVDAYLDGLGVVDWMVTIEPAWLLNEPAGALYLRRPTGKFDPVWDRFFFVAVDPASGVSLDEYMQTNVRVTGHFDDPAAQTCLEIGRAFGETPGPQAEAIETCRRTFVVTDVAPL